EIIELGTNFGIIDKSGAWYAYNGEKIGQGKENVRQYLKANPEVAQEIEEKIRAAAKEAKGVPALAKKAKFAAKGKEADKDAPGGQTDDSEDDA
ncbi:MAG: hypothetical protein LBL69_01290, partial [Zoogloeaceae bacterium]|nr:hypothetical protein [Zoogloeaceae bacterium]